LLESDKEPMAGCGDSTMLILDRADPSEDEFTPSEKHANIEAGGFLFFF
jgi:hypothetical protein